MYVDGALVYVGQSKNVRKRLEAHKFNYSMGAGVRTPWGWFRTLYFKVWNSKKYGDWAMVELRLIKRLQPKFNCVHGPKRRKEKQPRAEG